MKKIYLLTITLCSLFIIPATVNAQLGQLWGVTVEGGTSNGGVLYYFDANSGKDSVVYNFPSGASPQGTPMQAKNGNIYGITENGGTSSKGTIWEFNTNTWTFSTLANFTGANGSSPVCTLIQSSYDNNLYGTTQNGGTSGDGVIFQYNISTATLAVVYNCSGGVNGNAPAGGLVEGISGTLYGTTTLGGTGGYGNLFKFTISGSVYTNLHSFNGTSDGNSPSAGSLAFNLGTNTLYGVTETGGANADGTIFQYQIGPSTFSVLYSFITTGGKEPVGGLVTSAGTIVYGTTYSGGTNSDGVIFSCTNGGTYTDLFNFTSSTTEGYSPEGNLCLASDNNLYGVTPTGGANSEGALFKSTTTGTATTLVAFNGTNGEGPGSSSVMELFSVNIKETEPTCGNLTLTAMPRGYVGSVNYSWSTGATTSSISGVSAAGTYSVTATSAVSGIVVSSSITLSSTFSGLTATATATNVKCNGNTNGSAMVTTNVNTGPFTYSWSNGNTNGGIMNQAAGTYSVTVTDNSGCTATATVTITQPGVLTPTITGAGTICNGSSASLSASATGGTSAYSYLWTPTTSIDVPSNSNVTATPTTTTTYTLTVTDANNCTAATTAVETVNAVPSSPTASSNGTVCTGNSINLTASTVAGATYSWTGPNSFSSSTQNPSISNCITADGGTYSVTATSNGCTSPASTTSVTVNTTPATPTVGSNSPVCSGDEISLTATTIAGATYSWTGPNSFSSSNQNPNIVSVPTTDGGTYQVTATVSGCVSAPGTGSVTVNATPSAPTASSNTPVCTGNSINLTASTVAGATYSWTGPDTYSSTTQNPTINSVITANGGTYSVTATVNGCTSSIATTSVTVNTTPSSPTASSNSPVCTGNSISLSSSTIAGATYSWTGPNSFSSGSQNPSVSNCVSADGGAYLVTATVNGCTSAPGSVSVTVNTTPSAPTASSNSPVCTGNTISLTASTIGGATYSWTGPNSFSSSTQNPSVTNATTADGGNYSVTATLNGCTSSAGIAAVTVNTTPAAPTAGSNSPVCAGSAINLTASTIGGATYSWNGPASYNTSTQDPTIASATVGEAGTYSVTATVSGCTGPAGTVAVTVNALPAAPTAGSNTPVCTGNPINLTASTIGGATYSWSGPNSYSASTQNPTIASASNNNGGTYSVTATVSGCTGPAGTTNVTVNTTPAPPTASSNSPVCTGSTLNLTASNIGGATYSWSGPNSYSSGNQNPSESSIGTADAGTYSVTATVSGCTSAPATTSVTVNTTPSAPTAGSNSPVCVGLPINLTASTIGGATYSWSGPSYSASTQNPTIANATVGNAGTYSVTATVSGCTGPAGTTNVTVNTLPTVSITAGSLSICTGNGTLLSGNGASNYTWAPSTALTATTGGAVTASPTVTITYTVTGTDGNGCVNTGTKVITVNSLPSVTANATSTNICEGSNTALVGGGATSYSWTPNIALSSSTGSFVTATPTANVTYTVTGTDGNGCVNTSSVAIAVDAPVVSVTSTNASCNSVCNGTAQATGNGGNAPYTYTWSNSTTNALAIDLCAGSYTVTLKDNQGCTNAKSVSISQPSPISVSTTPVATTCGSANGQAIAVPSGGSSPYTYTWSTTPVQTSQTAVNLAAGNYTVDVTDANGCTGTGTVNIAGSSGVAITTTVTPSSCSKSDGIITAKVTGGTSPYIYSWNNGCDTLKDSGLAAGIYILTVTDKNGCSSFKAVNVSDAASPTVTVTSQNNVPCYGGSSGEIGVSVTGGTLPYIYSWSNSATTASITGLSAGPYQVTVTDGAGCITVQTINITQPSALNVTPGSVQANCGLNDGSAEVTVTGGTTPYTYTWSNGGTTSNIASVGVGTYSVNITDGDGCQVISNVSVSNAAGPLVTVDSVTNVNCASAALGGVVHITANGGIPPYTYLWSDGTTNAIDSSLAPGNYAVTVTDQSGCSGSANATVAYVQPESISICMATVDPATNYNNLLWDGSPLPTIKQYNIYKETTSPGVFGLIGSVPVGNNTYIDSLSDARIRSWRYEISQVDSCGNESQLSAPFKTMHLTVNLGASNSVNLIWDNFEGITFGYYIVYRDSIVGVAQDSIGYVTNNGTFTFTDYPSTNTNWYYHMGIANSAPCEPRFKPHSINYNASKSNTGNIFFTGPTGTPTITAKASTVDVYPNPNTGQFTVSMGLAKEQQVSIKIYDALGQLLQTENYGALQGKVNEQFNLSSYPKGIYMMQVITADGAQYKKIILQ